MKTPILALGMAFVALSTVANPSTREGWSGLLRQKSLDAQGRLLNATVTITAGITGSRDAFMVSGYRPPQPGQAMPDRDDIYASGTVLLWADHGYGKRKGYRWRQTFGGETVKQEITSAELLMDPIGVSFFSGLSITDNGRNKTIGGFALEVENRGSETITVIVTTDWLENDVLPAHRTTHGGSIPGGSSRNIAVVPMKDDWALASDQPSVEEKP